MGGGGKGGAEVVNSDSRISGSKILIFRPSFYKEKNTKLKLDMTTEKQEFYPDVLFYNKLQKKFRFLPEKHFNLTGKNQVLLR